MNLRSFVLAGAVAGSLIVVGEGILNGVILSSEWQAVNSRLNLPEPSGLVVGLALAKLFVLGFVIAWLYRLLSTRFGSGLRAGASAGLAIGLLIWGWVLAGLWLAGYINTTIAAYTFPWGMVETVVAGMAASRVHDKLAPAPAGLS
jgi:hypothetical protein